MSDISYREFSPLPPDPEPVGLVDPGISPLYALADHSHAVKLKWFPLIYKAGWNNYGGVFQVGQYAVMGELVIIRGLVGNPVPAGTSAIAALPGDLAPTLTQVTSQVNNGGFGRVDVDGAAQIVAQAVVGGVGSYLSINIIYSMD